MFCDCNFVLVSAHDLQKAKSKYSVLKEGKECAGSQTELHGPSQLRALKMNMFDYFCDSSSPSQDFMQTNNYSYKKMGKETGQKLKMCDEDQKIIQIPDSRSIQFEFKKYKYVKDTKKKMRREEELYKDQIKYLNSSVKW
jgi:hypothetical protein